MSPCTKVNSLARASVRKPARFLIASLQHPFGNVQPRYSVPRFRKRQGNPPRPATKFKHRIAKFTHRVAIKRDVCLPRVPE